MSDEHLDPPLLPMQRTVKWIESGPDAIRHDPELATLIIRLGMASNVLDAQLHAVRDRKDDPFSVTRMRNVLCSLIASAAWTHEAIKVVSDGMTRLRPLATKGGASEDLLKDIEKLCRGENPASAFLKRARNKLGFHWDSSIVGPSVLEFGRNERLVWVEFDANSEVVHRLALDVLMHALFPAVVIERDDDVVRQQVDVALRQMTAAMELLTAFCIAATLGFVLLTNGQVFKRE